MINQLIHKIWKFVPSGIRRRAIRLTQERFTVSAAAVILNAEHEVLLLEHVLRPKSGWGLPGGFLEKNEHPEAAIRREITEEIGIGLDGLKLVRVRTIGSHVEFIYSAVVDGEPEILSPLEILAIRWFDRESIPDVLPASQRAVIETVLSKPV